jgi:hypothetical protein
MSVKERANFMEANSANADVTLTVLEQPSELTGVSPERRDLILKEAIEAAAGPELEDLQMLEEAIEVCESAVEGGRAELHADLEIADSDRFNAVAAEFERKVEAPWLKNVNGQILVIPENGGSAPIATDEQIERGIIAATREEYEELRGAKGAEFKNDRERAAFVEKHGLAGYERRSA